MNIDIVIAIGIFVVSVTILIFLTFSFINKKLEEKDLSEIKLKLLEIFRNVLEGESSITETAYRIPISIKENSNYDRENEPIEIDLILDENCEKNISKNSIFLLDEEFKIIPINFSISENCYTIFLKSINLTFNLNISSNQTKKFFLYFHKINVSESNYTIKINTTSFAPFDGDKFTESLNSWTSSSGTLSLSNFKRYGNYSVEINSSVNNYLYLIRNISFNSDNMNNIKKDWYFRALFFPNDSINLTIVLKDYNGMKISKNFSLEKNKWNLIEESLISWIGDSLFNYSQIQEINFTILNTTPNLAISLKIDGLRFEKPPLYKTIFPAEEINILSLQKIGSLKSLDKKEIQQIFGGERVRIEIYSK